MAWREGLRRCAKEVLGEARIWKAFWRVFCNLQVAAKSLVSKDTDFVDDFAQKRASENPRKNEWFEKASIWNGNCRYFRVLGFGHRKSLKIVEDFPSRWAGRPSKRAGSERPMFIEDFASRAWRPAGHGKRYKNSTRRKIELQ